jgi:hypothetical protein
MAVNNETVLQKMMAELQQAKQLKDNETAMLKHIQHIRLLCDLFLDEEEMPVTSLRRPDNIESAEMKAMLGEKGYNKELAEQQGKRDQIDHDGANGDSIFDF